MALIMVRCPDTGAAVSTGHPASRHGPAAAPQGGSYRCTSCGQVHAWTLDDVWLKHNPGVPPRK